MRFDKYEPKKYAQMERHWLKYWRAKRTFWQSVESRAKDKRYIFYDGPPFITGLPHHGTLLSSVVKDVIPRYKTMQGFKVERRWGWDCHGLPAENYVEQKLGLANKQAVLEYGLENYIKVCQESMVATGSLWQETIERVARWVEFEDAYKTMDPDYMESVWWAFRELYEAGRVYEGEKILMYCSRCQTPVSKAEIAMDNSYKEVSDPSLFVKFALTPESSKALGQDKVWALAWTTTPWTLPANVALAANAKLKYVLVEDRGQTYLLAKARLEQINKPNVIEEISGQDLVGLSYQPLFVDQGDHRFLAADFVTADEGSGLVHIAPAYGEQDYDLAKEHNLPIVAHLDEAGLLAGQSVWQANETIIKDLGEAIYKRQEYEHSYPHCYRCQTRLIYKAHPSWFLQIADQKDLMLSANRAINWFPKHLKEGRFAKNIEAAPDWNISRDRFWATPLPVWRGQDSSGQTKTIVVGSYKELEDLSGQRLKDYHRPWVDQITFQKDGVQYSRVDKVLDCWFESGAMPFAQYHYPFENKEIFEDNFPADFIVEYTPQVRAWFYYLHVLSTALFNKPAFLNVITTGTIMGSDGRKMSKSLGNYTDPLELIETYSADAYRLTLVASPLTQGEDTSLQDKMVADRQRQLETLRHVLGFFLLYAQADGWQATKIQIAPKDILDRWLLARLGQLKNEIEAGFEDYDLVRATKTLPNFIDDLSNWYVRRSRKRFWKTKDDADKDQAYATLYFVLKETALLIAPVCPFLAEEIYQALSPGESVHLQNWPTWQFENPQLVEAMNKVRRYVSDGLAQRAQAGLKVRQPLAALQITDPEPLATNLQEIVAQELNVKKVAYRQGDYSLELNTKISPALAQEGLIREVVRHIQAARKKEGLEVSDRINLQLGAQDDFLVESLKNFKDYLMTETLTKDLSISSLRPDQTSIKCGDKSFQILSLTKH